MIPELPFDEFYKLAGVTVEELTGPVKPVQKMLSVESVKKLKKNGEERHPGVNFASDAIILREKRRGILPPQIARAEQQLAAWKRELKTLQTCEVFFRYLS